MAASRGEGRNTEQTAANGVRRSRAWFILPALLLGVVAVSCVLAVALVQTRVVVPPAGKLDFGAFSVVSGNELQLCADRRTVCGTFYRLDLMLPRAERASGQRTLLRVPLAEER